MPLRVSLFPLSVSRRLLIGGLLAILALSYGEVGHASAHPTRADRLFTKSQVFKAFKRQGLPLYDTGYNDFNPVTALASIRPHDGWSLGIYIFKTKKLALVDYNATAKQWKRSGMAVTHIGNVVVTAVPKGASLSRPAKPWPMPKLVVSAIAALSGKKS